MTDPITPLSGTHTALGRWLSGLLARAHANTIVVALAKKLARIAWAVLLTALFGYMALEADEVIRTRTRGSSSRPRLVLETGYVGAD